MGNTLNKDKQIEEMANAIEQARIKAINTTNRMNYGFGGWYAKEIYEKGYRKASEVAEEIFAEIEQQLRGLFDFFRQDDCIRESSAIMLAISEIAELKKKYTEEK